MDDYIFRKSRSIAVRFRATYLLPAYLYVDNRCRHANGLQIALDFEVITFQFIFFFFLKTLL